MKIIYPGTAMSIQMVCSADCEGPELQTTFHTLMVYFLLVEYNKWNKAGTRAYFCGTLRCSF